VSVKEAKEQMQKVEPKMSLSETKAKIKADQIRLSPFLKWLPKTIQGKAIVGEYENITGKWLKVEQIPDRFNEGRYKYKLTLEKDNMEKTLEATPALWSEVDKSGADYGDVLVLGKTGEKRETRYTVKVEKNG